ncbi:MAG TPA: hypothetical protein VF841_17525 [Anaeromyxobacter sp.]
MPVYKVSAAVAKAAVRPADLRETLESLRVNGAIRAFTIEDDVVSVEADQFVEFWIAEGDANERITGDGAPDAPTPPAGSLGARQRRGAATRVRAEARSAYYEQALAFIGTGPYRRLTPERRAIWRLHARGFSEREVAERLSCSTGAVARALAAIRPLAGLPRVTYVSPATETE